VASRAQESSAAKVKAVLATLERRGTKSTRDGMARYGIVAPKAFGVPVGGLHQVAKRLGRDHALALALWKTGWYEARMLTAFIDEPALVTTAQMERWARDFDNWAIVDTLCFHLFDRSPLAWKMIGPWSRRREEFVRRAAFALLACLALHDKETGDAPFLRSLALVERAARDDRNFVMKGVSWALRAVGRRSPPLHAAGVKLARKLAASADPAARWVGRDALRELLRPAVRRQVAARGKARRAAGR